MDVIFINNDQYIAETINVKTEAERYNKAWSTGEYLPMVGLGYVRCLYRTHFFDGYRNLLDVGCGTGAAIAYHRKIGLLEAWGMDFAEPATDIWKKFGVNNWCMVASAEDIPYRDESFDMVSCTDMMEHIPESNVKRVLEEIYRVGSNDFLFSVALLPAKHKMPQDDSEPHICLKPPEWWLEQMIETGYRFRLMPHTGGNTLFVSARKKNANKYRCN
jgi:ubiquinone/menaquinone biosynthesis C-methylase UbiE